LLVATKVLCNFDNNTKNPYKGAVVNWNVEIGQGFEFSDYTGESFNPNYLFRDIQRLCYFFDN